MHSGLVFDAKKNGLLRMPRFLSQIRAPSIQTVVIVVEEERACHYVSMYPLGEIAAALSRSPAFGSLERVVVCCHHQSNELVKDDVVCVISRAFATFVETDRLDIEMFSGSLSVCLSRITLNRVSRIHEFWFSAAVLV